MGGGMIFGNFVFFGAGGGEGGSTAVTAVNALLVTVIGSALTESRHFRGDLPEHEVKVGSGVKYGDNPSAYHSENMGQQSCIVHTLYDFHRTLSAST